MFRGVGAFDGVRGRARIIFGWRGDGAGLFFSLAGWFDWFDYFLEVRPYD